MTPGSTSYENILEVENQGSQLSRFFKLLAPVQITLESCTGLGEPDQYRIQMNSPNGCWLHENSMDSLFRTLSSRPLHRHDYFELMLVLEGEVIQQIEDKEYPYRAGTCCLVNRSILHNERFIGPAKLCFLGLSVDFVRSLTESASLQLFEAERHLPENPVLQFMLANLGQDLRKEYQDLFPTPENTDSVQTLTTLIARMTHILHEPSTAASYNLMGALCDLCDFLSSGCYVTPVHLSSSPESLLFLRISRMLEELNRQRDMLLLPPANVIVEEPLISPRQRKYYSVKQIAKEFDVDPRLLNNFFEYMEIQEYDHNKQRWVLNESLVGLGYTYTVVYEPIGPYEELREYMVWTPKGKEYLKERIREEQRKYQENRRKENSL